LRGEKKVFSRRVYQVVLGIPLGETRTYKWVARKAGSPRAQRAVGQALKNNPYPLIIPCHRVVGSGKNLGGYSGPGGRKGKEGLIKLERQIRQLMV
jgi:methylated-DNA-[protein]-cysteine S-methyltransferase